MSDNFSVDKYLIAHKKLIESLDAISFDNAIQIISKTISANKKIITCGNGGSASTASHYITDWNKMDNIYCGKKLRGISLCDNIGLITAYANDISYDEVFSGQLKPLLDDEDLVIGISGSGNSKNVINAIEYANNNNANSLAIVGYDGGELISTAKHCLHIPTFDMQLCEDVHLMFGHMVMKYICNTKIENN